MTNTFTASAFAAEITQDDCGQWSYDGAIVLHGLLEELESIGSYIGENGNIDKVGLRSDWCEYTLTELKENFAHLSEDNAVILWKEEAEEIGRDEEEEAAAYFKALSSLTTAKQFTNKHGEEAFIFIGTNV